MNPTPFLPLSEPLFSPSCAPTVKANSLAATAILLNAKKKTGIMFSKALALRTAILAATVLSAGSAGAAIIYSDSFDRVGALDGTAPVTAPGSETCYTHANWTADGDMAKHQVANAVGNHAMLPFTPEAGKIYTLEAEIDANASNAGWFVGIGFYPSLYRGQAGADNGWARSANPFLFESYNGWKAFMPLGMATSPVATGTATAGVAEVYAIELDTREPLWTVSFYVHENPVQVYSTTYTTNPTIGAVGIIT